MFRLKAKVKMLVIQSYRTLCNPWTVTHQAPVPMGFPRQEYWSGFPHPALQGIFPNQDQNGVSWLQADSSPSEPPGKPMLRLPGTNQWPLEFIWLAREEKKTTDILSPFGTLEQGSPISGIQCLMIWGGADIKNTINVMCLNHPETIPWPRSTENLSTTKPGAQKIGFHCSRAVFLQF